jgi:NAD-dependent deacetylase
MDIRPSWDEIYLALTMRRMGTAAELAALIGGRGPAVVLTGAGMSTESGIPDFRSAGGIWAEVDPFEVASIDAFRRDPLRVWRWYGPRIGGLLQAKPNAGHLALASLERAGHVRTVVTQNIDLLHSRAGSADVVELHGSIREFVCLACGETEKLDGVLVVVGSSLQVWPVAGLPSETVRAGGELAIVNDEPTPYDGEAALLVRGRAGEVLEAVSRALDG